jgi:hypothetical protein
MSCRPRGPSDRPLQYYYDELELGGAGAPRLPTQSLASRLLIAGVAVCCCGIVAVSLLFAVSLVANLPHVPTAAAAFGPGAALVSIEQRGEPAAPPMAARRAQRNVLARLATLKRAQPPATGADYRSMQIAFPHWFELDGDRSQARPAHALPDMALALSYLAQEDAHNRG